MTRRHCMLQLLKHGPLTLGECCTFTGWPVKTVRCVVADLVVYGLVVRTGPRGKGVYSV